MGSRLLHRLPGLRSLYRQIDALEGKLAKVKGQRDSIREERNRLRGGKPKGESDAAGFWDQRVSSDSTFSTDQHWFSLPAIQRRANRLATGDEAISWVDDFCSKFLHGQPVERMCSHGCGTGHLERALRAKGVFRECDGTDISPESIRVAEELARGEGFDNIHYQIRDLNTAILEPGRYDAVWFSHSLHHVENLEHALGQVARSLKPGGWLFFDEYVGASYFGFGERQQEIIRSVFSLLPQRFRRSLTGKGEIWLSAPQMPDPVKVRKADPSESVRSAEIMGAVRAFFDIETERPLRGGLLHILLSGIAGNFREENPEARQLLDTLVCIEDTLTQIGELPCDFVAVAARPKSRLTPDSPADQGLK